MSPTEGTYPHWWSHLTNINKWITKQKQKSESDQASRYNYQFIGLYQQIICREKKTLHIKKNLKNRSANCNVWTYLILIHETTKQTTYLRQLEFKQRLGNLTLFVIFCSERQCIFKSLYLLELYTKIFTNRINICLTFDSK